MARRANGKQTTLHGRATVSGIGVHSGRKASVTFHPAEADSGIYFYRTNCGGGAEREIPADYRHVSATELCTTVGLGGVSVATIEHLMATLRAVLAPFPEALNAVTTAIESPQPDLIELSPKTAEAQEK